MTRIHAWLEQAATGSGHTDCPCCARWRQLVADHLEQPITRELDRHAQARIRELERDNHRLEQQLAAYRRNKGAA